MSAQHSEVSVLSGHEHIGMSQEGHKQLIRPTTIPNSPAENEGRSFNRKNSRGMNDEFEDENDENEENRIIRIKRSVSLAESSSAGVGNPHIKTIFC